MLYKTSNNRVSIRVLITVLFNIVDFYSELS